MHAHSRKVLVVVDEPLIAFLLTTSLTDAGYEVVGSAASAAEAVALAGQTRPALVVMDVRLQGHGDGIDAATEIRHRFGIASIIASATIDLRLINRGRFAAPVAWLHKPYALTKLVAVVDGFFGVRSHLALRG
jgi:DNA-binding response OmpR family regulator